MDIDTLFAKIPVIETQEITIVKDGDVSTFVIENVEVATIVKDGILFHASNTDDAHGGVYVSYDVAEKEVLKWL